MHPAVYGGQQRRTFTGSTPRGHWRYGDDDGYDCGFGFTLLGRQRWVRLQLLCQPRDQDAVARRP